MRWRVRGLQENGISPGGEEGATLLEDHGLASLCTQFLLDLLSHSVHPWRQGLPVTDQADCHQNPPLTLESAIVLAAEEGRIPNC